ncbi:MAG: hypothetical protein IJD92_02115 [Bacilli bacterium]|nr:hypothetical protein [Bacilli bacterium]
MVLETEELMNINGGANGKGVGIGIIIAAIGSFIIGLIDGFLRPLKCN